MAVLATIVGVALIALIVHDIFTVLFRPGAEGHLSGTLVRGVWKLLRRLGGRRHVLAVAGPLALASVICSWATLLVLGWALIYLPHYPQDFAIGVGSRSSVVGALHVSLATITTLGSSVTPKVGWLQIVSPIEALIGFGLLTAAVAYLLQLYPVLSRRRALAYEIHLLDGAVHQLGFPVAQMEPLPISQFYGELTSRLIAVQRDLVKFPIAYYFAETDARFALATALPVLAALASWGTRADNSASVRLRAAMLQEAIDDFAETVAERFLARPHHSTAEALRAFARDHLHAAQAGRPDGAGRDHADLASTSARGDREGTTGS